MSSFENRRAKREKYWIFHILVTNFLLIKWSIDWNWAQRKSWKRNCRDRRHRHHRVWVIDHIVVFLDSNEKNRNFRCGFLVSFEFDFDFMFKWNENLWFFIVFNSLMLCTQVIYCTWRTILRLLSFMVPPSDDLKRNEIKIKKNESKHEYRIDLSHGN